MRSKLGLSLLALGCGSGDEDPGGPDGGPAPVDGSGGGDTGDAGPCGPNEIRVWGMLDGESIDVRGVTDGHIISGDTTSGSSC